MKEKDITEKMLLSFNDVFADVINGTFFEGREVVDENDLSDVAGITHFKSDDGAYHEQIRDLAKVWNAQGIIYAFIGVENQTKPDRDMILRVLGYDGATYKMQVGNEKIYPVRTLVIYWGKGRWTAPLTLKERLGESALTDEVSDYSYRVVSISDMKDAELARYKSDFRQVAEFIAKGNDYEPTKDELKHPEAVLDILNAVLGDDRFRGIKDKLPSIKAERRTVNMCELLDKIENRGIEKGILEGIEKGRIEGFTESKMMIAKAMKLRAFDTPTIAELTGLSIEEIERMD